MRRRRISKGGAGKGRVASLSLDIRNAIDAVSQDYVTVMEQTLRKDVILDILSKEADRTIAAASSQLENSEEAQIIHIGPVITEGSTLRVDIHFSESKVLFANYTGGCFLCFSLIELLEYFPFQLPMERTFCIYPDIGLCQGALEVVAVLCIAQHISEYVCMVFDSDRCPELRYLESIRKFARSLWNCQKDLYVFHVLHRSLTFENSKQAFCRFLEVGSVDERHATHIELSKGLMDNYGAIQEIRGKYVASDKVSNIQNRLKTAFEITLNQLYCRSNRVGEELPFEESGIKLTVQREACTASMSINMMQTCEIRPMWKMQIPTAQVYVLPLLRVDKTQIACSIHIHEDDIAEKCCIRCGVYSNDPKITFEEIATLSSFLGIHRQNCALLLPATDCQPNTFFSDKLRGKLSNLLVLCLHYSATGNLNEYEPCLRVLRTVLIDRFQNGISEGKLKPIIVLHHTKRSWTLEQRINRLDNLCVQFNERLEGWGISHSEGNYERGLTEVEGPYLFDHSWAMIHRVVDTSSSWKDYNAILFENLYHTIQESGGLPLSYCRTISFPEVLCELFDIKDESGRKVSLHYREVNDQAKPIARNCKTIECLTSLEGCWSVKASDDVQYLSAD